MYQGVAFMHHLRIDLHIFLQTQRDRGFSHWTSASSCMCQCDDNCGEETFLLLHDSHRLLPCGFGFSFLMRDPAQALLECNWKQLAVDLMSASNSCHTKASSAQ